MIKASEASTIRRKVTNPVDDNDQYVIEIDKMVRTRAARGEEHDQSHLWQAFFSGYTTCG